MASMKAVVITKAGGPEVLQIQSRPIPVPQKGQVLIRVKAAGLNRSEMFSRQGLSPVGPGVKFPLVLGIEAVGVVASAPGDEFAKGDIVATAVGGLGREFDGAYAEYTCVPAAQIQKIRHELAWETLGAMPELYQTVWGSLFKSLQLQKGERLLIRGGSTSVGLAAAAIAKGHGAHVTSTSRRAEREALLRANGAEDVIIDSGSIAQVVRAKHPDGFDKVLELIGTTTMRDSLQCARLGGVVCMTGVVGNAWSLDAFNPNEIIPPGVRLTSYGGRTPEFMNTPLNSLIEQVIAGTLRVPIGKTFKLDQIVEAHRLMEENEAAGKIVILMD